MSLVWSGSPQTRASCNRSRESWQRGGETRWPLGRGNASGPPYSEYKRPPSVNGYYLPVEDPDGKDWSRLRRCHLRYLDLAMQHRRAPDWRTIHDPELLERLAEMTSEHEHDAGALGSRVLRSRLSSAEDRRRRLAEAQKFPSRTTTSVARFERNPDVIAEVLRRAGDKCDLCRQIAPFDRLSDGSPYLEVHHCTPLAVGGEDTIDNAIALCPTCHRRLHFGMSLDSSKECAKDAWRLLYANRSEVSPE